MKIKFKSILSLQKLSILQKMIFVKKNFNKFNNLLLYFKVDIFEDNNTINPLYSNGIL